MINHQHSFDIDLYSAYFPPLLSAQGGKNGRKLKNVQVLSNLVQRLVSDLQQIRCQLQRHIMQSQRSATKGKHSTDELNLSPPAMT